MNFTREPVIETIISPKEGYRLLVRSSKASGQEEYQVDAVEVVSFGNSFFFRSLEKPRSFLVPVSDYEVVEVKEARVTLKNAPIDRTIKISGGREAPMRTPREVPERREEQEESAVAEEGIAAGQPHQQHPRGDRRRDRRRHRRRRGDRQERGDHPERVEHDSNRETPKHDTNVEGGGTSDETQVSSSMFTPLFPPPPTLISETLSRYKEKDRGLSEGSVFSKPVEEEQPKHEEKKKKKDDDEDNYSDSEGNQLHRVVTTSSSMSFVQESSYTSFTPSFPPGDWR
ncbi:MAG: hypothetical protein ACHQT8_05700 [Chlamydiales bacterium]